MVAVTAIKIDYWTKYQYNKNREEFIHSIQGAAIRSIPSVQIARQLRLTHATLVCNALQGGRIASSLARQASIGSGCNTHARLVHVPAPVLSWGVWFVFDRAIKGSFFVNSLPFNL
jgi:hypothetical protein